MDLQMTDQIFCYITDHHYSSYFLVECLSSAPTESVFYGSIFLIHLIYISIKYYFP